MKALVVGLMGSGKEPWKEYSEPLAEWLALEGYHLLTGGGSGVMTTASEAYCRTQGRKGICIGVLPTEASPDGRYIVKSGYPNQWVELSIVSPLATFLGEDKNQISRNHINILTSDAIVALPGSKGTLNEVELAVRFNKPVILFGPADMFANFPPDIPRTGALGEVKEFFRKVFNK